MRKLPSGRDQRQNPHSVFTHSRLTCTYSEQFGENRYHKKEAPLGNQLQLKALRVKGTHKRKLGRKEGAKLKT